MIQFINFLFYFILFLTQKDKKATAPSQLIVAVGVNGRLGETCHNSCCLRAGFPLTASELFSHESMAMEHNPLSDFSIFPPFDVIEPKHICPAFQSLLAKLVSCIFRLLRESDMRLKDLVGFNNLRVA